MSKLVRKIKKPRGSSKIIPEKQSFMKHAEANLYTKINRTRKKIARLRTVQNQQKPTPKHLLMRFIYR